MALLFPVFILFFDLESKHYFLPGTLSLLMNSQRTILFLPFLNGHGNIATGLRVISGRGSMSSKVSNADISQGGTSERKKKNRR